MAGGAAAGADPGATLRGARVTLRPWCDADLAPFAELNADRRVMAHFIAPLTREQSDATAGRARAAMAEQGGWGWWALDVPGIGFAGFTGLAWLPAPAGVEAPQSRVVEIGWRLAAAAWGQGYATEAARLALAYAFQTLGEPSVFSFTASSNLPSQRVMVRLGLQPAGEFGHPRVPVDHPLHRQLLFRIDR